ncbi:t-SNARE [Trichodelitschia bisporula]|uniref:t-SNARE n=1 Tax=Trichodelitschia bisporula TaxID=703511 RepID=A0A6G1HPL1_9PEZI|nr:t-SNARE [Trichodelitschia bisporula]
MSYSQYGGNPYGGGNIADEGRGYGQAQGGYSQPSGGVGQTQGGYSAGYGGDTYGSQAHNLNAPPLDQQTSNQSQASQYSNQPKNDEPPRVLSNSDFYTRVDGIRKLLQELSDIIGQIAAEHEKLLTRPVYDRAALDNLVSQAQAKNATIKDQILFLEKDVLRSGSNVGKSNQLNHIKREFKNRIQDFQQQEVAYRQRSRQALERQYEIVYGKDDRESIQRALESNSHDQGVFQQALLSSRNGASQSTLDNVRNRHNDIAKIEQTLIELNQLFQDLQETVVLQDPAVQAAEQQTDNVVKDTEQANTQLHKSVEHARRARKLKWWCFGICVLVVLILALVLGLVFGLKKASDKA